MKPPEFRCGAMRGLGNMLKVGRLLTSSVIIVLFCSVQVSSFHHDSFIVHTDCPVCKFLTVPSSGGEAALHLYSITTPGFASLFFALNLLIFLTVMPVVRGTRAPPYIPG